MQCRFAVSTELIISKAGTFVAGIAKFNPFDTRSSLTAVGAFVRFYVLGYLLPHCIVKFISMMFLEGLSKLVACFVYRKCYKDRIEGFYS